MKLIKEDPRNWKVNFDEDGKFLPWHSNFHDLEFAQKENFIFEATMKLSKSTRGRSAVNYFLIDLDDGKEYQMRHNLFIEMLLEATGKPDTYFGYWTFDKQGSNYSIKFLKEI